MLLLLIAIVCGIACYKMAEKQGRTPWVGLFVGFLLGIIGVIGYAVIGDSKNKVNA